MAISRYRQPTSVRSNYVPQEFTPDFTKYAAALTNQQAGYDQALAVKDLVPKHLSVDAQDVIAYKENVASRIDELSSVYADQGVTAGNRYKRDVLQEIRKDWQPGGKAANFEKNYSAYQDYIKQLDEVYKKGDISSHKKDRLKEKSLEVFQKSYNDDVYKEFDGITAAKDVHVAKQADELAKGWAESKVRDGVYTIKNGQYYDVRTRKFVDPQEIYDNILPILMYDPTNLAYFEQESLLRNRDKTAFEYAQMISSEAAQFAANKYGKSEEDSQYLKNWAMQESMKQKNAKDLFDYQNRINAGSQETVAYTVNSGLKPLDLSGAKIKTGKIDFEMAPVPGGGGLMLQNHSEDVYSKIPLEEFASSEQGMKEYPGLSEMINMPQFQRQHGKAGDPNWVEPDDVYNERVTKGWDSKIKALSVATGVFDQFNSTQSKEASTMIFGDKNSPGSIVHKPIWLKKPGQPLEMINHKRLMELTGLKTVGELNERSRIIGNLQADNGIHPSGYEAVISSKNGKETYSVVIGNTSIQHSNYNKPLYELMSVGNDGSKDQSEIVPWQPRENFPQKFLFSRGKDRWNEQTYAARDVELYEVVPKEGFKIVGTDQQGNVLVTDGDKVLDDVSAYEIITSDVTPEELINANENLDPYLPTRLNKKMKNE